ncbi:MAG: hypothetical protein KBC30_00295 [Planctomycetes bacterium]|nr:hypothetical protein [Planctomycetota bacterium]HPY73840.1 hypothetical protein [Planctomycetota bacterium]HQA99458.1 hypothetical protein [Planctomycetota bacterium]
MTDAVLKSWKTIPKHSGLHDSIAVDTANIWLAVLNSNNTVDIYLQNTGEIWKQISIPASSTLQMSCVCFSLDGKYILTGTYTGEILVWSLPELQLFKKLEGHTKVIQSLQFSLSGKIMASAGADANIILWTLPDFTLFRKLVGHHDEVKYIEFSKNGKLLYSISNDNTIKFWQINENEIFNRPVLKEKVTEKPTDILYKEARLARVQGQLQNAMALCKEVLQRDPLHADTLYLMATIYYMQSESEPNKDEQYKLVTLTLEHLNKSFENGFTEWAKFQLDPTFIKLQKDIRFQDILSRYKDKFPEKETEAVVHVPQELAYSEDSIIAQQESTGASKPISFIIQEENGLLEATAIEIMVNGKVIEINDKFFPGYNYDMIIKFKDYATVKKKVYLQNTGAETFTIQAKFDKLKICEFFTRDKETNLDGLIYPYKFYVDDIEIEDHLIEYYKKGVFYYYTIRVPLDASKFRVLSGYLYEDRYLGELKDGITRLERLSVPLLMKHLELLAKTSNSGYRVSIVALEKLVKSRYWSNKLKYAPTQEIGDFLMQLETWNVINEQDIERVRMIVDAIESLVGGYY